MKFYFRGLKLMSKGEIKPVCLSLSISEVIVMLKSLRKLRVEPEIVSSILIFCFYVAKHFAFL